MRGVEANLLAGWQALWAANLAALVPGGLWPDRAPQNGPDGKPLATPYAEITVRAGKAQYNSAPSYLKTFAVEVTVWSVAGGTAAGPIQAAVGRAFDPPAGQAVPAGLAVAGAQVIRVDDTGGAFELDPARVKAGDVVVAKASWDVLLNVPR